MFAICLSLSKLIKIFEKLSCAMTSYVVLVALFAYLKKEGSYKNSTKEVTLSF